MRDLSDLFGELEKSSFRKRQRLNKKDRDYLVEKTLPVVVGHARQFIVERLAPAQPSRDGKQTPWHGHPAFVAQHATATCCRGCLVRWHRIPQGRALIREEIDYVVEVIEIWLQRQEIASAGESKSRQRSMFADD